MKRQVILLITILACISTVCLGRATEYPADRPIGGVSGWPNGLTALANSPQRVAGFNVNFSFAFFYKGTTEQLNGFLQQHAKLDLSALWVTVHPDSKRESYLWPSRLAKPEYRKFDWKLTILKRNSFADRFENLPAEQDHIIAVDIWLDAGIDKDSLVIPNDMAEKPSIVEILSAQQKKQEQTSPLSHSRMGIQGIVNGNTKFTFDLYKQLKDTNGNLFFSPYSISTALAMTYAGARGKTQQQMAQTLHFSTHQREFAPMFGRVIDQLNKQGQKDDYQLSVANALWTQKDYAFLDSFVELNKACYKAGLENVDFVNETEKSRQTINQWVERRTEDKIKNLIPEGVLDAMTRLVLTNAIYFKGDWAHAFDAAKTSDQPFYITPRKTVTTPLMFQKAPFEFGQTPQVKILKMPYKGDDLSMILLLPREEYTLADVESQLTAETFEKWEGLTGRVPIRVFLPKFKMTSQFSLADTLAAMGMPDAFCERADFSGMDGTQYLYISAVLHKAFVEVNEEGTEAAAATGVGMSLTAMPARPAEFRADRPFIFAIKDNSTDSILFVGRITDPTKQD